jgi:lipid-binding SYLF domain-containing protein
MLSVSSKANHVLQYALNPGIRGIPKGYFMTCAGICILSTVQAGFIFSGSVGTGIFMKRELDGSWSNPVACGITGVGFGLVVGATLKDVIIFMPDEMSLQTFFSSGAQLGAQANVTVGVGREFEGGVGGSASGTSAIISIAYTKGAFVGATMEGAIIAPRTGANEAFYGFGMTNASEIIEGKIAFPTHKQTMMAEVKDKLGKLAMGLSELPGEEEKKKAEAARAEADKAAESAQDVVEVDAQAEAAKGN